MTQQFQIPHDENHRFLEFGPLDGVFTTWVEHFKAKKVPFEIGGGGDRWTIYKHQQFVKNNTVGHVEYQRCCPMVEDI